VTAIQRLLGESGDWSFSTIVYDVDLHTNERYFHKGKAVISWSLDPDVREWGVKDITPTVNDFTISVVEDGYDEPNDRDVELKAEFTKADFEGYEIVVEIEKTDEGLNLAIVPKHISVDSRRRRVTVIF
jgi:hypothetical protein